MLKAFVVRMASLAVRERSRARLQMGLNALAFLGGSPACDLTDVSLLARPLRDAAHRLAGNTRSPFRRAARLATAEVAGLLLLWRPSRWFFLRQLGYRLGSIGAAWPSEMSSDGFRYMKTHGWTRDDLYRDMTKKSMRNIVPALECFKEAMGRYPTTEEGLTAAVVFKHQRKRRFYQVRIPREILSQPATDLWGNPLVYRSLDGGQSYELFSAGGRESDPEAIVRLPGS